MKRTTLALAAIIGTMAAAQPALAESATVTYRDLDLSTDSGRQELDRRIDRAARDVCGSDDMRTGTRVPSADARACYKDARKQIESRIALLTQKRVAGN